MPDPTHTPVDHDPFAPTMTPVDHDPFGSPPTGNVAGSVASVAGNLAQRGVDWWKRQPTWSDQMAEAMQSGDLEAKLNLLGGFAGQTTPSGGMFQRALSGQAPVGKLAQATTPEIPFYHASPHNFEKFDMSKIGTGEGAQAYGHGLYVAENRKVAEEYYRDFRLFRGQSKMYQGTIKADPDHFLHWDKPANEQSKHVWDALDKMDLPDPARIHEDPHYTGAAIHDELSAFHEDDIWNKPPDHLFKHEMGTRGFDKAYEGEIAKRVTESLKNAGILGIRYFDRDSRNVYDQIRPAQSSLDQVNERLSRGEQHSPAGNYLPSAKIRWEAKLNELKNTPLTHNFVVFRDDIMHIIRKYGIAGLIAGNAAHFQTTPVDEDPFDAHSSAN